MNLKLPNMNDIPIEFSKEVMYSQLGNRMKNSC